MYKRQALSKAISEIGVNATNIELKVSKGGSIADINASVASGQSEVKISADAISLEGAVTANDNFKINEDGSMETTRGTFNDYLELHYQNPDFPPDNSKKILKITNHISGGDINELTIDEETGEVIEVIKTVLGGTGTISIMDKDSKTFSDFFANVLYGNHVKAQSVTTNNLSSFFSQFEKVLANNIKANSVKTFSGADLDTVKAKADGIGADLDTVKAKAYGSLKSTHIGHATGTSSAFPSVDITSVPAGTMMRIEVGIPIDNASEQTMAWFSTSLKKGDANSPDYLYNVGGYYYSANYNASVFINVSSKRITFNPSWTNSIGGSNASAVNNLKSKSTIYVYIENL